MTSEAYPLEHWSSRIQPLPRAVAGAVEQAVHIARPIFEQEAKASDSPSGHDDACALAASLIGDWLASADPARFLEASDRLVFSRGDQNLANALWDGERIRFVDFEYCGWNDLARDLSLMTEHIQSYGTPIEDWDWYIDQFDLTPSQRRRALAGRRRQALSWLANECLKPGCLHSFPAMDRIERLLERARQLCR